MRTVRASPTELRSLTIERMGERGEGIGRLAEVDVHVSGAFVGETAEVIVEAVSRHHPRAHARLSRLIAPHPARRESPCPNDVARGGRCTGCPLLGLGVEAQREAHRLTLERTYGLVVDEVVGGTELGYRWASKRIAFDTRSGIDFGSFRRGTRRPASMEGCLVEHPRVEAAVAELRTQARALGVRARGTGGPVLEGAWLKTDGERVLLTLLGAGEPHPVLVELARSLTTCAGVHYSQRREGSGSLRGERLERLAGASELELTIAGVSLPTGPLGFLQPNPEVAARAYAALVAGEGRGALAFDLYAGAGITTALLRRRFERVTPCESYAESAASLGVEPMDAASFLRAAIARGEQPELVTANPPRGGMGPEVTALLLELRPAELAIMSCNAKTLARELEVLEAAYVRRSTQAFDTLPQTGHLEVVVRLARR